MTSSEVEEGMVEEIAEATGVTKDPLKQLVASLSFMVAIGDKPVPELRLEHWGGDPEWFVKAKHPKQHEAKIKQRMMGMTVRPSTGDAIAADDAGSVDMRPDADGAFLLKCLFQITDYCLPGLKISTGEKGLRTYNSKGSPVGDNRDNTEVFEGILYDRDQGFRKLLEEYLDWVAGRPHEAVHDFEALGNAPGQ